MNDLPPPLPPCTEVILEVKKLFKEWDLIGSMNNQGVEVYIYKKQDVGDGATYTRFMFTPSIADVNWAVRTGWTLNRESSCLRNGFVNYTMFLTTRRGEKL